MAHTLLALSENDQIVFTTHSPLLLNEFASEDIRKVKLNIESYQSEVEVASLDSILAEIGYSSQDILNTDYVIFVEGQADKEVFELLLPKYYSVDMNRITIVDTKSCKKHWVLCGLATLNCTEKIRSWYTSNGKKEGENHGRKTSPEDLQRGAEEAIGRVVQSRQAPKRDCPRVRLDRISL